MKTNLKAQKDEGRRDCGASTETWKSGDFPVSLYFLAFISINFLYMLSINPLFYLRWFEKVVLQVIREFSCK